MENKKLLKFLFKDIDEIEELFDEKGKEGFDGIEIEFLKSRFVSIKKIIQIMSEQENDLPATAMESAPMLEEKTDLKDDLVNATPEDESKNEPIEKVRSEDPENKTSEKEELSENLEELKAAEENSMEKIEMESVEVEEVKVELVEEDSNIEPDQDEEEKTETARTLGDSFHKEKSLNELLTNGASNLEFKISNSPVASIQTSIGINDRYQYIRELFEGNSDKFMQAVTDLDGLSNINEAVAYLQQNYKWKKTETSLKFVSLVKRRFPNG